MRQNQAAEDRLSRVRPTACKRYSGAGEISEKLSDSPVRNYTGSIYTRWWVWPLNLHSLGPIAWFTLFLSGPSIVHLHNSFASGVVVDIMLIVYLRLGHPL